MSVYSVGCLQNELEDLLLRDLVVQIAPILGNERYLSLTLSLTQSLTLSLVSISG